MTTFEFLFAAEATDEGHLVTPWFQLIANNFLYRWWDSLSNLESHKDQKTIHRMISS